MMKFPALQTVADQIDQRMNVLLTNKEFLRTASLVINLNSYRRKWTRTAIQRALVTLQLPVRSDQEKMLAILERLNDRIEDLGGQLHARQ